MNINFLDEQYKIISTFPTGLIVEAFNNSLYIPYGVLNESKSEAPLYRVLGPRGTISAIMDNEFTKNASYGICFTRNKNYWIGDLDSVPQGTKLFQFRINQYKLASDYKILPIAETSYQPSENRSEYEERILETVKNVDRYLECIDTRKGFVETHIKRLVSAVNKYNNARKLLESDSELISKPIKLTRDLFNKLDNDGAIYAASRNYIEAIAVILDKKIPLGENLYNALDKFQIKHSCSKFTAPAVSSNFGELEAKVKEIQAKLPPQPNANPNEESPLIEVFKANIDDYSKKLLALGYQVTRITDLNYNLHKSMDLGNNYTHSSVNFSAILTPSDILVTLTFDSKLTARDAIPKLEPLGFAIDHKNHQILFPIPIDINDFHKVETPLMLVEQALANEVPYFHDLVLDNGFKFNKAKLTYTRKFSMITVNIKLEDGYVEFEIKFSNKIFAPESSSVQELKQSLADQYHLYSNGKHFRLTEFPKNFENLVKSVEIVSDRLAKAKKRYEDNEEMFLKMLDQIRAAGFKDYNRELSFRASTMYADFYLNVDAEFWTANVVILPDYRLGKKGIKLQEVEFFKNNPLYTKMNFGADDGARLSLQSFDYLEKNLKDLADLIDDFKNKSNTLLDSPDAKRFRNMISYLDLEEFEKDSKYYIKYKGTYENLPLEAVYDRDDNNCNLYINDKDFCKSEYLTKIKNFKNGTVNMSYMGYANIKFYDMDDFRHFVKKFIKLLKEEPFDPLDKFKDTSNDFFYNLLVNLGCANIKNIGTILAFKGTLGHNFVEITIMTDGDRLILRIDKNKSVEFTEVPSSWSKYYTDVEDNADNFVITVNGRKNIEALLKLVKDDSIQTPPTESDLKNVGILYKAFGLTVTDTNTRIKAEGQLGLLYAQCATSKKSLRSKVVFRKSYKANSDVPAFLPQFKTIVGADVIGDTEEVRAMIDDVVNLSTFLSKVETFVKPDKIETNSYDKVKDQLESAGYKFDPPNRFYKDDVLTETAIYFEGDEVEVYLEFKDVVLNNPTDKELAFSCFLGLTNKHKHDIEDNGIVFYMSDKVVLIKEVVHTINCFNDAFSKVMAGKKNEVVEEKNIFIDGILEELKKQAFTVNNQKSQVKFEGFIKSMNIDGLAYKKTKKVLLKIQDSEFAKAFVNSLKGVGDLEVDDSIQGVFYVVTHQVNFFKEFFKRANEFTIPKVMKGLEEFEDELSNFDFKRDFNDVSNIITYISIGTHDIKSVKVDLNKGSIRLVYANSAKINKDLEALSKGAKISNTFQKDYVLKFSDIKDATNSIKLYKTLDDIKVDEEVPNEVSNAAVKEETTEVVDNVNSFKDSVIKVLNDYNFVIDDNGSDIIVFLKTMGSIKVKGSLHYKKDKIEVKLPKDTPITKNILKQVPEFAGVKHIGYVGDYEILSINDAKAFETVVLAIQAQSKLRKGDLINKVFDLKFKKTGEEDHDDAIDRILAYVKKNKKSLVSRADVGVWLLDNPKELGKYKLEFPAVMLMFYESDKYDIKKDPIFMKFYKCKALSIIRQPFKTKDLNGNECTAVCFYDAKTASKYKLKLIEEAIQFDEPILIEGVEFKVADLSENKVSLESKSGIKFVSSIDFLNIDLDDIE